MSEGKLAAIMPSRPIRYLWKFQRGRSSGRWAEAHRKNGWEPAPLTTDEQFSRRVTLDLTGRLPEPADVEEFVADRDLNKRAQLIDRLPNHFVLVMRRTDFDAADLGRARGRRSDGLHNP